jgi:hypothetical protein
MKRLSAAARKRYSLSMQVVGTVVTFGAAPAGDAARLDSVSLDCEVLPAEFRRIKRTNGGTLLFALLDDARDPALAGASKAVRILKKRGGGEALVVLPPAPAIPGPQALARLQRAAEAIDACVVQPIGSASWADAVRCFVEPLTVFGLAGVDPAEIHALVRPRVAFLHDSLEVQPGAREILITCRLPPSASLRDLDDAARTAAERAPQARLILAGPEVQDDGPRVLSVSLL